MPDETNVNVETPVTPPTGTDDGKVFNLEDIQKARTDEKNKLYPQIEKLKAEVAKLNEKLSARLLSDSEKDEEINSKSEEIAVLTAKIEKLEAKGEKAKVTDSLAKDLQVKLDEAIKALDAKDAEIAQIKLTSYKAEKIKGLDESVVDIVSGNTEAEIDASVEKAKALYEKISAKFATKKEEEKPETKPATSPTETLPKVNLSSVDASSFNSLKAEDIVGVDVTTPQGRKAWQEMKSKLGL